MTKKWAIFLCSAMAGSFTTAAVLQAAQGNWWPFAVNLFLALGFSFVPWFHLDKLKEEKKP